MKKRIQHIGATWLFLTLILGGCSINASDFGEKLATIDMAHGDVATLRRNQGSYSIRFESSSKEIEIPFARNARHVHTEIIGDTTLIVIESERIGCPKRHLVYAMTGDTGIWRILDESVTCTVAPQIIRRGDSVFFDTPAIAGSYFRQTYFAGDLTPTHTVSGSARQLSLTPRPAAAQKDRVATPPKDTPSKTSKPSTASSRANSPKGQAVPKSELPAQISFEEKKSRPAIVNLEK